jgi:hypothetical protein
MSRGGVFSMGCLVVIGSAVAVWAQGPPAPPPTCEEQLNNEMFQKGGIIQQLAVARAQLGEMTKARDEAKAALVKAAPAKDVKPPEEKK